MQCIIDRFEGDIAVLELPDATFVNMPRVLLPDAKEGDVVRIEIDRQETEARAKRIKGLMDSLWED